jgi:hypothetical protein
MVKEKVQKDKQDQQSITQKAKDIEKPKHL